MVYEHWLTLIINYHWKQNIKWWNIYEEDVWYAGSESYDMHIYNVIILHLNLEHITYNKRLFHLQPDRNMQRKKHKGSR